MNKEDRLYKLFQGSDTAVWAHDEIQKQDKRIAELERERDYLLRLISYVRSIVFSKVKCGYASFKRPLEELLKDQSNG